MEFSIRTQKESKEDLILSPFATKSSSSKGRARHEEPCEIRTCFERDRDRIIHSKAFRRLKHKTQVFIAPEGDHYRTRLTHTLEVSQVARSICSALALNETLAEAIALGHDLGHTPFGHIGESILNEVCSFKFEHNEQSLRVVDYLEGDNGLNLCEEVRDGIVNHCTGLTPHTLEAKSVFFADKIAYINHDIDDLIRSKIMKLEDLPQDTIELLGKTSSERIDTMICDIVKNSYGKNELIKGEEVNSATNKLRGFLFRNVYLHSEANKEGDKAKQLVYFLFEYFMKNPDKMPKEYFDNCEVFGKERSVCDYISGMSDNYAIAIFKQFFIPTPWIF